MAGEWSDPQRVSDYLAREIPYRDIAERLLAQALPERVESFVDLGTGAGRLIDLVHREHPSSRAIGLDVSEPMLIRARDCLGGRASVELIEHDLTKPLTHVRAIRDGEPLDAFVSALAIHHLEHERKQTLFAEVRELLRDGGVFVNLDLTASPTAEVHARFREAIGRVENDPTDRLASACEQLTWLRDAGFAHADCRFKWMELTLFVASRDSQARM